MCQVAPDHKSPLLYTILRIAHVVHPTFDLYLDMLIFIYITITWL